MSLLIQAILTLAFIIIGFIILFYLHKKQKI
jgi:hypothetical protein